VDRRRLLLHLIDELRHPAVTVARKLSDSFAGIAPASAPMFILMQFVGAAVAYPLIRLLFPSDIVTTPDRARSHDHA
jgi:arsenate reductase